VPGVNRHQKRYDLFMQATGHPVNRLLEVKEIGNSHDTRFPMTFLIYEPREGRTQRDCLKVFKGSSQPYRG